ncbi:MAG TPA: SAM-dependent methyltransferase [Trebonia sp.]|nr:SAM-dependent methyltransferase [Trebonia sp.]
MEIFPPTDGPVPEIDPSKPHSARIYDYGLGGKNHFAADRAVAEQVLKNMPQAITVARENRRFLGRAVRYLVAEAGVSQFLDIGAGLPTTANVHEVAQRVDPKARIVYVDNDPLVLVHARALLKGTSEGRTGYIHADLKDPAAILADPVTKQVLDFSEPVGLILVSVLPFLTDADKPGEVLATLLDALPSGSYLAATHTTAEHDPEGWAATERAYSAARIQGQLRDSSEFARMAFAGLKLMPPGVVLVSEWRPDDNGPFPAPAEVSCYGGVARKQ